VATLSLCEVPRDVSQPHQAGDLEKGKIMTLYDNPKTVCGLMLLLALPLWSLIVWLIWEVLS